MLDTTYAVPQPSKASSEDCMNAKNTNKTVPQCRRTHVETYIQCTLPGGPGKPTNGQDAGFDDIWKKTCSAPSVKAIKEYRGKTDSDNKCKRERNDNNMKCLLNNTRLVPRATLFTTHAPLWPSPL